MYSYSSYGDQQLFDLLREREKDAYAEIYKRYWALLYRHALRMVRDEEIAEDVIQDTFMYLWDKAAELDISSTLSSYLYTAVRNRIVNYWTREKVKERYIDSLGTFRETENYETDFLVREKELRNRIEEEIAALPENLRKSFELSRNANMTYREIAEELGISENAVRHNVSRALKVLRTRFGDIAILLFIFNS